MYWLATKRTFRSNSFDMILTNDSEMKKYFGFKTCSDLSNTVITSNIIS